MPIIRAAQRQIWTGASTRIPGVLMFGHYQQLSAHPQLAEHRHRGAIEICFLARGEQTYRTGDQIYRLRGGDQFVTLPDEWHDSGGEPQQKGELYWVIVQSRPTPNHALNLPPALHRPLLRELQHLPSRHFRAATGATDWLHQIEAALTRKADGYSQLLASSAMHQFLVGTVQAGREGSERTPHQRVREAMDWMEAHLCEPIRIHEVAQAVGWSEAHFKAAFRDQIGQAPHDYIVRRKIDKARHMLRESRSSVTDTAFALGFSSSQHFATAFKKYTNETPTSFRSASPR